MNTVKKWIVIGCLEVIFCFWLLGNSANLVSAPSTLKVWLGIFGYCFGVVLIPGASILHIKGELADAQRRQHHLKSAFPDESFSMWELLDRSSKI